MLYLILWVWKPSMWIAVNGLAGQTFSHAPQPMHLLSLMVGILSEFSSEGSLRTILTACAGQCLAQFPQLTLSVFTIQRSWFTTASPIWIDDFSTLFTLQIAPVGQTSEQRVHSGRQ
jgi:hypothetical protein